jgi:hypothetical protein
MTSILRAALQYATLRGWYIFPAPYGEKKSHKAAATNGGLKWGMTKDPAEIMRDWAQWTNANVGIPTGAVNGIFVVEADTMTGHGVDGLESLRQLWIQHGVFPETLMARSPSGSVHHHFQHPGAGVRIKNSDSDLAPGVDVRGDGGMVIAPPSLRRDGAYEWINEGTPIAQAPQWLLDLVVEEPREARQTNNNDTPPELSALAEALAHIPNDGGWENWNNTGMALWRATGGSNAGLDLFDEWSAKSAKYDAGTTARQWDKYHGCPPSRIGGGSIFYWADQASPGWRVDEARRRADQIEANRQIGGSSIEPPPPTIMTVGEMNNQLVWVGGAGAIIHRKTGAARSKKNAETEYAASKTIIDNKPVQNLTLWLHSSARTSVDVLAWVPGQPEFCAPPEGFDVSGGTALNMWRGLVPMPPVDNWLAVSQPFQDHLDYLIPIDVERARFLKWLAHIIQHPEVLPHTCYLMITPTTGIGRNWLASVMARVLRSHVAIGVSLPDVLDGNFNGRLSRKLLAIVDELREGPGGQRYQRAQRLKSVITEENRLINPKYGVQTVEKNVCRWMMFSNHFDALPIDNTDRRVEIINNPTTRREPAYYAELYRVLDDWNFIASVRQLLMNVPLGDFNPGQHAAMNVAKVRALAEMRGDVEHKLEDFKEDCATPLVSRRVIESSVNLYGQQPVNGTHLTHAINSVGMVNTGRRVKDANGIRHKVVIVNSEAWSPEMVEQSDVQALLRVMELPPFAGGSGPVGSGSDSDTPF